MEKTARAAKDQHQLGSYLVIFSVKIHIKSVNTLAFGKIFRNFAPFCLHNET